MNTVINLRSGCETANLLISCCRSYVSQGEAGFMYEGGKSGSKLLWKKGRGSIGIPRCKW